MTFLPNPKDLPGCTLLPLPAEVDLCNALDLFFHTINVVEDRTPRLRVLVLDLTRTDFIDSQGIRLVDDVRRRLRDRAELRVVADPDGMVHRLLELTGLRRDVPVYDNLAAAVRS
ncbi:MULTISPECIES: STAS domain-containing protein [unclassified Streptomyces]|uniref:STAS domain-containing protein n=1 Tax=unclassified Streptomyces TaxID=2593676 RepID=UPI0033A63CCE